MEEGVSIIIPTYKRVDFLSRSIQSILNQTYQNIEIIVVDDNQANSLDRQATLDYMAKFIGNDKVKYILHPDNKGACAARNTGIRESSKDMIAFLDDDDEWEKNYLEEMVEYIKINDVEIAYCNNLMEVDEKIYYPGEKRKNYAGNVYLQLLAGWCPATTSLFIGKKKCFVEMNGFDESLLGFQDYDMWLRLSKKYEFGYNFKNLVIKHEGCGEQLTSNPFKREKALEILINKWVSLINENEKHIFENFIKIYKSQIDKLYINYYSLNNINYKKIIFMKKVLLGKLGKKVKIQLLLIIIFGKNMILFTNKFFKTF